MYCSSCGREIGDSKYCPICGAEQKVPEAEKPADSETPVYTMPAYSQNASSGNYDGSGALNRAGSVETKYRTVFSDYRFMVIAILETAAAILSMVGVNTSSTTFNVGGVSITISVFPILFTIALWIIYASAKSRGSMGTTGLAMASGTLKAMLIVIWVGVIIMIVVAVLLLLAGNFATLDFDSGELSEIIRQLEMELDGLPVGKGFYYGKDLIDTGRIVIAIICIVVAVIVFALNITCMRKLHRFAKSVCVSLKTNNYHIRYPRAARNWLIALAVFAFIGTAGSFFGGSVSVFAGISSLCSGIAAVLGASLISNYFISNMY